MVLQMVRYGRSERLQNFVAHAHGLLHVRDFS